MAQLIWKETSVRSLGTYPTSNTFDTCFPPSFLQRTKSKLSYFSHCLLLLFLWWRKMRLFTGFVGDAFPAWGFEREKKREELETFPLRSVVSSYKGKSVCRQWTQLKICAPEAMLLNLLPHVSLRQPWLYQSYQSYPIFHLLLFGLNVSLIHRR